MKLAKKMLVSVLALAMVAALALTAFAATPTLTYTAGAAEVGKEVTITVSAKDMVGTETASIFFSFDAEALEFVSSKSVAKDAMGATGLVEGENTVSFALAYTNAAEGDDDLVVMTFKVLKAGDTTITGKVTEWTGTEAPTDVTVTVKATEPTTVAPTTVAPTTAAPATEPTSATTPATTGKEIAQTGEAGIAAIAGVMALAAVAFVATRKKDEE